MSEWHACRQTLAVPRADRGRGASLRRRHMPQPIGRILSGPAPQAMRMPGRRRPRGSSTTRPVVRPLLLGVLALAASGVAHSQPTAWPGGAPRRTAWFVQTSHAPDTRALTVGAAREWRWAMALGSGLLTGQTEAALGHWRTDLRGLSRSVSQIGVTPSLRYYFSGQRAGWFLEGGIGLNYLTPNYRRDDKRFSTRWNFGDHLMLGRRFGSAAEHEVALRVQHYSNAGLEHPNPGENFMQMRYAWYF